MRIVAVYAAMPSVPNVTYTVNTIKWQPRYNLCNHSFKTKSI